MIKPPTLSPGDTIRLVAPAGPFDRRLFDQGVAALLKRGYQVEFREDIFHTLGYLAGDDARRLHELHEAFADPKARAVMAVRGGYGSGRLLRQLDPQLIRRHPKLLIGFSDITALHCYLVNVVGQTTLHGPMLGAFAEHTSTDMLQLFWQLVEQSDTVQIPLDGMPLRHARANGILVGGNLAVLQAQLGLPWFPDLRGKLLFLEDTNEPAYRIDRMLTHLREFGVFERLQGLLVGDLGTGDADWERRMVSEVVHGRTYPVITGCSIGHPLPLLSLPLGVMATLDTTSATLTVESPVQ